MKLIRKSFIILCALATSAYSQILLQPGEVFTYTFTNLPQVVPGTGFSPVPVGLFTVSVSSFDAGDVLLVEMFENGTNEAPLLSFVQEAATDGSSSSNAWADFQGTVRLTMVVGSVQVESLLFAHEIPTGPSTWERHQLTVVPVEGADLVAQLVPCTGPLSGGTWKNHGQYVSTVAKTARDLVRQGLITQEERNAAVQEAAHSSCGKKEKKPKKPKH